MDARLYRAAVALEVLGCLATLGALWAFGGRCL